ncbi:MAG: hypothetical protein B6D55_01975 [Candidatus Omnitrophica bacterium 4484_70.2]|nr:MAG: hypothetical protein B6D55_01975 [Candidatus Omnitrophica bacterium 4484_70.2]
MNLKEEIKKLIALQEIDSSLYLLRNKKDKEKPQEMERLKNAFLERKSILSTFEEEVKQLQLKRKEKELELSSKEENIRKAQSQLYQLKTNKEYQAKLTEISSLKADVSLLEEDVIKILDEIEEAQKRLEKAKEEVKKEEERFKAEEKRIKEEIKEMEIKISELENKRKQLVSQIDSNLLSTYQKLLETRSGIAITYVDENENCGACHIKVTAQKINEIKMYKELVFCENCVRILYVKEDFE